MKVVHEKGSDRIEVNDSWRGIGPSYIDLIRSAFNSYESKEMYIGDFVKEYGYEYDLDKDIGTNNSQLLFYILENRFNIKIPQQVREVLLAKTEDGLLNYPQDPETINSFIATIQDEETRTILKEMQENGEIKSTDKVKDVLFIKTIIDEVYKERVVTQEKDASNKDEQEGR